jgi:hypothetical protein
LEEGAIGIGRIVTLQSIDPTQGRKWKLMELTRGGPRSGNQTGVLAQVEQATLDGTDTDQDGSSQSRRVGLSGTEGSVDEQVAEFDPGVGEMVVTHTGES